MKTKKKNLPAGAVIKNLAIGAIDLGFDSWTGQMGYSVTNDSPPLRYPFAAVLPQTQAAEMGPCHFFMLHRNAVFK